MHKLIVKGGKGGNVDMGYKGKSLFYINNGVRFEGWRNKGYLLTRS